MKNALHRFGKFYSKIMIQMIGIFIFAGLLSVIFGDYGWFPNRDIYAISQLVYNYVVPILIAYIAGNQMGKVHEPDDPNRYQSGTHHAGGALGVVAISGVLLAEPDCGFLGAMILGPICGFVWKNCLEPRTRKVIPGLEMLTRNLVVALTAAVFSIGSYYILAPAILTVVNGMLYGVNWLVQRKLLCLVSILVEPAKVFFLNNCIHHGIFLPLAVQQTESVGSSLLYLVESNPGPGLGLLAALWLYRKERRKEYAAYIFAHSVGGIHEIYFSEALSNLFLIFPLILGGMAGNLAFSLLQVTASGVISPGSVITIFIMTGHHCLEAAVAVGISALVSGIFSWIILSLQQKPEKKRDGEVSKDTSKDASGLPFERRTTRIGFVCDAGVGSSAMGAGLFRRILKEQGLTGVEAEAYSADQIPDYLDWILCQKNLKELLQVEGKDISIEVMESLLNRQEQMALIEKLKEEGRLWNI